MSTPENFGILFLREAVLFSRLMFLYKNFYNDTLNPGVYGSSLTLQYTYLCIRFVINYFTLKDAIFILLALSQYQTSLNFPSTILSKLKHPIICEDSKDRKFTKPSTSLFAYRWKRQRESQKS